MTGTDKKRRRLKFALILTIILTIGIVVTTFMGYRKNQSSSDQLLSDHQSKASISIGKVHQTATKNGANEWSLTADSAHYFDAENRALFDNIEIVFYMEDRNEVRLSADHGYLQTDSKDIDVEGNVVLVNGNYLIEATAFTYKHKARSLYSGDRVKVSGDLFTLSADTVSVDLNTQQSDFKGNVKGVLSEAFNL